MTNGLVVMTPSSIAYSGTSASVNADGSVVFSACSSLSLNGVFTGDYDNYMMTLSCVNTGGLSSIFFRWRASGTDESSASNYYTRQELFASGTLVAGGRNSDSRGRFGEAGDITYGRAGMTCYIFGPYLSQPTATRAVDSSTYNSSNPLFMINYATTHSLSALYDGITITPSQFALTGLLTVFGFNQ